MPSVRVFAAPTFRHLPLDSKVVVRATTGLERLLASEVAESGHTVEKQSKRQLVVSPADRSILTHPPQLADDLFVLAADAPDPGPSRPGLFDTADNISLDGATLACLRPSQAFAVSASFVGRRNYSRFDIEDTIGRTLSRQGIGAYVSRRDGGIPPRDAAQWRVTFDGSTMYVGPRPFPAPLHRRPWRTRTVLGSVHPPVAAAMARLADIDDNHTVVDPCCGAGTIPVEAHAQRPAATFIGSDIDLHAIAIAGDNSVGLPVQWNVGDAGDIDIDSASVDRVVTNPPWGVRRKAGELVKFLDEWHRILRHDGLLVVLLDEAQEPALAAHPRWALTATYPMSFAGRHPRIFLAHTR